MASRSMHTPQEWAARTELGRTLARSSQHQAAKQVDSSTHARHRTVSENLARHGALSESLRQKLESTNRQVDKLQARRTSLMHSIQESCRSLNQIEEALFAKEAPLSLCTRRMSMREKRPLREQVRDQVESALAEERTCIGNTQQRLKEAVRKTKAMICALQDKLAEVTHDLDHKRQAYGIDNRCYDTVQAESQNAKDRIPPHMIQAMGQTSASGPSSNAFTANLVARHKCGIGQPWNNEQDRSARTVEMDVAAKGREAAALKLVETCAEVIRQCKQAQEEAASKTDQKMRERIMEVRSSAKKLEKEIRNTEERMAATKQSLHDTQEQLNFLEHPAEMLAQCGGWREQRAIKELIKDPVSTRVRGHQIETWGSANVLIEQLEADKAAWQELVLRRGQLQRDLDDKSKALQIEVDASSLIPQQMNPAAPRKPPPASTTTLPSTPTGRPSSSESVRFRNRPLSAR